MLNDTQILKYRQQLLDFRQELEDLSAAGEHGASTVELDQARVGRLSRMDALQGQAMSQEAQRRRKAQLVEILQALRRIETGVYGECQDCGEDIKLARLDFKPETKLCIECANATES